MRVARAFVDRLTLSYPRGSTKPQLGWRKRGEGGRVLIQHTLKISGELRTVTLYETEAAMAMQVWPWLEHCPPVWRAWCAWLLLSELLLYVINRTTTNDWVSLIRHNMCLSVS